MALSGTVRRTLDSLLGRRLAYSAHLYLEMRYHDLFGPNKRIWDQPLIFIHIPKAAGSSILKTGVAFTRGHVPYSFYEKWLPRDMAMPRTFAIVRNPYDRFVSAFLYLRDADLNHIDRAFRSKYIQNDHDIDDFVIEFSKNKKMQNFLHFKPQSYFILDGKGQIAISRIIYFEELSSVWPDFAAENLLKREMTHEKKSRAAKPILSEASRKLIGSIYAADFDCLNYTR